MSATAVPIPPVKRSYLAWLWLGIVVAIALGVLLALTGTHQVRVASYSPSEFMAWHATQRDIQTTASGLQYQVIDEGNGPTITDGDGVSMTLSGVLRDGSEFQPKGPFRLQIGQAMIPGFTEALKLMRPGAHYRVWLPPALAYGENADPSNPVAGKVLIFDIAIDQVIPAPLMQQMMQQMQGGSAGGGTIDPAGSPQPGQ